MVGKRQTERLTDLSSNMKSIEPILGEKTCAKTDTISPHLGFVIQHRVMIEDMNKIGQEYGSEGII